jgi:uncharacterized protein
MSLYIVILLTVAAFLTSIISATIGMAGGIVLLSFMTFFMELQNIVPVHGMVQLVSNISRTVSLRKFVFMPIVYPTLIGLPIGTYISTQLITSIENKEIFYFLISGLIFYTLFKPKKLPALKIPYWGFGILAVVQGILGPLVGATGPAIAAFYLRDDLNKEQMVATKAINQTFGHALKIPAFIYLGFDYLAFGMLTLLMCGAVIFGTQFGVKILHKIDEKTFRMIFRAALFVAAMRVLYKAIISF